VLYSITAAAQLVHQHNPTCQTLQPPSTLEALVLFPTRAVTWAVTELVSIRKHQSALLRITGCQSLLLLTRANLCSLVFIHPASPSKG